MLCKACFRPSLSLFHPIWVSGLGSKGSRAQPTDTCTTGAQHRTLQERAIFSHHPGHFRGIAGEVQAKYFGGVLSAVLDTVGYDPLKIARKFWQPAEALKRNQHHQECSTDSPAEFP